MKAITARAGKAHITPLMDSMWHQGIIGNGSCVFDAYEKFAAEIISNNEIRIKPGIAMLQGRFYCIEPNTYDSVTINNGTQGESRIDIIVARWSVNAELETEKMELTVIQGTPSTAEATAPQSAEGILDNGDLVVDYPLYEVHIEGIAVTNVKSLFSIVPGIYLIAPNGIVDIKHGGTGLSASPSLLINLASTTAANVLQANPRAGVTGTLPVANGGTGVTTNAAIGLKAYPVGAVYISYVATSPASLFGGTWTAITGVFPYFNAGTATGGSNTHTLTIAQMPAHTHETYRNQGGTAGSSLYVPATEGSKSPVETTSKGGGAAHNNMPAYQTLYAWRRTA